MFVGLVIVLIFFLVDYFYGYLNEVVGWNLLLFIVFCLISGIVLVGLVLYWIVKVLDKIGVIKFFRLVL